MDKISFLFDDTVVLGTVSKISDNVIKLTCSETLPKESVLLSGFNIINEHNGNNMTDDYYHGYTTIYKNIDSKIVLLSNDGSVYVKEDDVDDSSSITEPAEPYVETLEEAKVRKISELSNTCQDTIIAGVDVEIDGITEHFSCRDEDQINIKELFDLSVQTNCGVYYHADGKSCKLYTVEQIISIYATASTNKMQHTTYFNQLRSYVETLEDIDSVNAVVYGQELTGTYLDTYNASIEQAQTLLNTLLAKRTAELANESGE